MDMTDQEIELVNSLRRALTIADLLSLQLVAIKIAEALDQISLAKGKLPPRNGASSDGMD